MILHMNILRESFADKKTRFGTLFMYLNTALPSPNLEYGVFPLPCQSKIFVNS